MKQVRTIRCRRRFVLPGGTDRNDLWVEERRGEHGEPVLSSTWQPTDEEREAIAKGANVELCVWGEGTPPVYIGTSTEQLGVFTLEDNERDAIIDIQDHGRWTQEAARVVGQRFRAETYAAGGNIAGDLAVLYLDVNDAKSVVIVGPGEEEG
jgi:hypothetical protein